MTTKEKILQILDKLNLDKKTPEELGFTPLEKYAGLWRHPSGLVVFCDEKGVWTVD